MDLLAGELGGLSFTGEDHRAAGGVHFDGMVKRGARRNKKELLQHLDYVVVSVVVIVEKYHVE